MYWHADGFVDCVVAEFVDALGTTLATGALDAWAVDGMRDEGSLRPADRVFARAFMFATPLMVVTGVAGGYLFDINPGLPWPCGAVCFATAGVTGLLLMREQRRPAHGVLRSWVATTRNGFAAVRQAPVLLVLCLLTGAIAFSVMPAWHYWPARLQALSGTGTWLLGWVWALIALSGMAGNALMPRLVPRYRREPVLAIANMWRGSMLVMGALSSDFLYAVIAVLFLQMVFGLSEPTLQGWMNEHVGSEVRATVLSVRSMAFTLGGGMGLVCLGLLARANGIPAAWLTAGVLVILVAPGFFLLALAAPAPPEPALPSAAP
jgi:predicted MFS family arabinose efflux permease